MVVFTDSLALDYPLIVLLADVALCFLAWLFYADDFCVECADSPILLWELASAVGFNVSVLVENIVIHCDPFWDFYNILVSNP